MRDSQRGILGLATGLGGILGFLFGAALASIGAECAGLIGPASPGAGMGALIEATVRLIRGGHLTAFAPVLPVFLAFFLNPVLAVTLPHKHQRRPLALGLVAGIFGGMIWIYSTRSAICGADPGSITPFAASLRLSGGLVLGWLLLWAIGRALPFARR